jgi:hypothetical protein
MVSHIEAMASSPLADSHYSTISLYDVFAIEILTVPRKEQILSCWLIIFRPFSLPDYPTSHFFLFDLPELYHLGPGSVCEETIRA